MIYNILSSSLTRSYFKFKFISFFIIIVIIITVITVGVQKASDYGLNDQGSGPGGHRICLFAIMTRAHPTQSVPGSLFTGINAAGTRNWLFTSV
jgi:hypothetical protein